MKGIADKLKTVLLALPLLLITVTAAPAANVIFSAELNENTSCPYLFTWGGTGFQLENDIYSVARTASREYTDYLLLNNALTLRGDNYDIEIRETRGERSWTDNLRLLVIDHPAEVKVGPDASGQIHSYIAPAAPVAAVDDQGRKVLAPLAVMDGYGLPMTHGATVTLDFSAVDITSGAKLVLRIDGFEGKSAGDVTGEIPAIQIQTLQDGTWTTREAFYPKEGPATGVFDLKAFLAESKTIRLLSVSCDQGKYHLLDYAALDNSVDNFIVQEVMPTSAVDSTGTDLLGLVSAADNIYAAMQAGDVIRVSFPRAPALGEDRSFVFAAEGYYLPDTGGNTYYFETWDGFGWIPRGEFWGPAPDTVASYNLSAYLPDVDGEFKVRVRNQMGWDDYYAEIDWVNLNVDGADLTLVSAQSAALTDIRPLVLNSDDSRWNAMNTWAVFKFTPNAPPAADPGGPYTGYEGTPLAFDGSGSSDPDGDPLTYNWAWGDGSVSLDAGPTPTHTYADNGNYDVCLTVTDPGGLSDSTCTSGGGTLLNGSFETGSFAGWMAQDLAQPYWPLHVGGSGENTAYFFPSAPTDGSFLAFHGFDGCGPGTIRIVQDLTIPFGATTLEFDYRAGWDIFGGASNRLFQVSIEPAGGGTPLQTWTVLEADGGTYVPDTGSLHGTLDIGAFAGDAARVGFNWLVPECFSGPAQFQLDNVTINSASGVVINNVNPVVAPPLVSLNPVPVNTAFQVSAAFTDPGTLDTHITANCNFGDGGDPHPANVSETGGSGTANTSSADSVHTDYTLPGIYNVTVTVTDDDGGTGTATATVVAYDPSAGFITGGGWIESPAGAYKADLSLTGKANFGFVSKYQKGATKPTGQTEFNFQTAGLNFHSASYDWMVVTNGGTTAQYKGVGTINGTGVYRFMLWAKDGVPDKFRIKIWEEVGEEEIAIYDNGFDQPIQGGSIMIKAK